MAEWPDFSPDALLRRLVGHGVDFVVVGGMAMVFHGSVRNTRDLDICYSTDRPNLDVLGAALMELDAKLRGVDDDVPFVPDGLTLRRTSILTLKTPAGWIDLLFQPAGAPPYEDLRNHAVRMDLGGYAVLVASLDDLAAMKKAAGRPRDIADLEEIEVIRRLTERG